MCSNYCPQLSDGDEDSSPVLDHTGLSSSLKKSRGGDTGYDGDHFDPVSGETFQVSWLTLTVESLIL